MADPKTTRNILDKGRKAYEEITAGAPLEVPAWSGLHPVERGISFDLRRRFFRTSALREQGVTDE